MFRASKTSTKSSPLVFAAGTVLRPTAAKKGGKLCLGVVESAGCFTARWHESESESSCLCHAAGDATCNDKDARGRGRAWEGSRTHCVVDQRSNEKVDCVARYRFYQYMEPELRQPTSPSSFASVFVDFNGGGARQRSNNTTVGKSRNKVADRVTRSPARFCSNDASFVAVTAFSTIYVAPTVL